MKIAALVLAAGGSARLGQAKQLIFFEGKTFVRHAVDAAAGAGCSPIIVVVGRDEKEVAAELIGTRISIVPNESWEKGIGTSIRAGLENFLDADAVIILVCDQPHVDATVVQKLIEKQAETEKPVVASAYSETVGVPALFVRAYIGRLLSLGDEQGAKSLLLSQPNDLATVDFPEGAIDIDTPNDYEALNARRQKSV